MAKGTIIAFSGDHWTVVTEDIETVEDALEDGSALTALEDGEPIIVNADHVRSIKGTELPKPENADAR